MNGVDESVITEDRGDSTVSNADDYAPEDTLNNIRLRINT